MAETISASSVAVNGYHHPGEKTALKILIVGAGIAGLSAGVGLRQQGHEVHVREREILRVPWGRGAAEHGRVLTRVREQIYEQGQFAVETGAALHIAPNAHGVLKRLGVDVAASGANLMRMVRKAFSLQTWDLELTPLIS